jgi:Glyoxalase-like domain
LTSRNLRRPAVVDLDHVGLVERDLVPLMTGFDRLGFALTEPRAVTRQNPATGERESLDQSSCHAVLTRGYIELSSLRTGSTARHLAPWLDRERALRILALGSADVLERHAVAARAGLEPTEPALASRQVTYGRRHGEARFRWFALAPGQTPEGFVCVVRNLTPELVYQREAQRHPNGAVALTGVTLCVDDVDATAARYAHLTGVVPSRPGGADRMRDLPLSGGVLRIATGAALVERYPSASLPPPPCFMSMTITVRSLAGAVALLGANDVEYRRIGGDRIWMSLAEAGGTIVEMQQG